MSGRRGILTSFLLSGVACITIVPIRVAVLPQLPYVICDQALLVDGTCPGHWYGFTIDMVETMFDTMNALNSTAQYVPTYYKVADGAFGSKLASGAWSGLVGDLVSKKADFVAAAITITPSRMLAVSFTVPWMAAPYALLIRTPVTKPNPWSFTEPFDQQLWSWVMGTVVIFAAVLVLYERISPFGLRYNPELSAAEKRGWNTSEAVTAAVGALFGTVNGRGLAWSTRIILFSMYFFSLIVLANYTANLTAFAAIKQFQAPVGSIEQVVRDRIPIAVLANSSTSTWIIANADPQLRRLQTFWTLVPSYDAAIEVLRAGKVDVIFGSLPSLRYYAVTPPCDLSIVGETAAFGFFGGVAQMDSPYYNAFNYALAKVVESGLLATLDNQYFSDQCVSQTSVNASVMSFAEMSGVFLTLLMFLGAATVSLIIERVAFHNRFKKGPCKIWRRLNVCCGFHYDLEKPKSLPVLERVFNPARLLRMASSRSRRSIHFSEQPNSSVALTDVDPDKPSPLAQVLPEARDLQLPLASDWKVKLRVLKR